MTLERSLDEFCIHTKTTVLKTGQAVQVPGRLHLLQDPELA